MELGSCMMWGAPESCWVNLKVELPPLLRGSDSSKELGLLGISLDFILQILHSMENIKSGDMVDLPDSLSHAESGISGQASESMSQINDR